MNEELASVRGIVDHSPRDALDKARDFLRSIGYDVVDRTDTELSAERQPPGDGPGRVNLGLTVTAVPQPNGGVRIKVNGTDREGMQEEQSRWVEWSERLPRRDADASPESDKAHEPTGGTILEAKGVDGQVALLPDRVRIGRQGLLAKGKGGDREIYFEQLGSVEFKSGFAGGRIQFVPRGREAQKGWRRTTEYEVQFNAQQSQAFEAIRRESEQRLRGEQATGETATAPEAEGARSNETASREGRTASEEPLTKVSGGTKDLLVFDDRLELHRPLALPAEVETMALSEVEAVTVAKGANCTNFARVDVRARDGRVLSIGYLSQGEAKATKQLIERQEARAESVPVEGPGIVNPEAERPSRIEPRPAPAPETAEAEPATPQPAREGQGAGADDIPELIRKLAELRDAGIVSGQEFEAKKKQLLDRI